MKLDAPLIRGFSEHYLKANYDEPVATPSCHDEWWDLVCQDWRFVAIAAPREHAKSTAITHAFVLAAICFRIRSHVLIVSDTEGQAAGFLGDIRDELAENDALREAFGIDFFEKDSETEVIVRFVPDEEGRIHRARIIARGSMQKLRGMKWRKKRPDLIVGDDLENDELVENEERRYKFRRWFLRALLPSGSKSCWVRIVGTILHEDSMLNRLMPKEDDPNTEVVNGGLKLRHRVQPAKNPWRAYLYRAHPDYDDFSAILWPEQHPKERLLLTRSAYEHENDPQGYSQEYLNRPTTDEIAYYKRAWFLPIEVDDKVNPPPEEFYIAVDMAISDQKKRALTCFAAAGQDHKSIIRFWEIIRERMDSLEIVETMFELDKRYRAKSCTQTAPMFLIEEENIAKAIGPFLDREMEQRKHWLNIELMKHGNRDKVQRSRPFQAMLKAGSCRFDDEAEWYPTFMAEMTKFPFSSTLDQNDACAWIGQYLNRMTDTHTPRELIDEQYDLEVDESDWPYFEEEWGRDFEGANPHTGY
jgi:phage terminase large subunit-like protein